MYICVYNLVHTWVAVHICITYNCLYNTNSPEHIHYIISSWNPLKSSPKQFYSNLRWWLVSSFIIFFCFEAIGIPRVRALCLKVVMFLLFCYIIHRVFGRIYVFCCCCFFFYFWKTFLVHDYNVWMIYVFFFLCFWKKRIQVLFCTHKKNISFVLHYYFQMKDKKKEIHFEFFKYLSISRAIYKCSAYINKYRIWVNVLNKRTTIYKHCFHWQNI